MSGFFGGGSGGVNFTKAFFTGGGGFGTGLNPAFANEGITSVNIAGINETYTIDYTAAGFTIPPTVTVVLQKSNLVQRDFFFIFSTLPTLNGCAIEINDPSSGPIQMLFTFCALGS